MVVTKLVCLLNLFLVKPLSALVFVKADHRKIRKHQFLVVMLEEADSRHYKFLGRALGQPPFEKALTISIQTHLFEPRLWIAGSVCFPLSQYRVRVFLSPDTIIIEITLLAS